MKYMIQISQNFIASRDRAFILYLPLAVFLLCALNSQAIIYHDWLPVHDTLGQMPEFLYAVSAYQNGELPLWLSYLYGGQPFYLWLHHGLLLNPIMWIWVILGTFLNLRHMDIFVYYHLTEIVFLAAGGFFLIRELFKDNFIASVAFVILLFSGDADYWSNQIWNFTVILYVPWLLFFGIRYFQEQTVSRCVTFAIFLGISMNVYIPSYTIVFIITLTLLLMIYRFDLILNIDFRKLFRHILIAIPIIAIMILPLYLNYSEITQDNYQVGRFKGINQQQITYEDRTATGVIVSKGDLNRLLPGMFSVKRVYTESVPLIGIFAFIFMLLGVKASRNSLFWFSLLMVMILNYMAWSTPYHYISFYIMPTYKMIRSYGFFSGYIVLVATILSCIGLQGLIERRLWDDTNIRKISFWRVEIFSLLFFIGMSFYLPKGYGDRTFSLIVVLSILFLFLLNNYFRITTILNSYKHILIILFLAVGAYNLYIINGLNWHNVRAYMFSYTSKFDFSFTRPDKYTEAFLPRISRMPYENLLCCKTVYSIAEKIDAPWFFEGWGGHNTFLVDKNYYHLSEIKGFNNLMKDKLHFFKYYTVIDKPAAKIGDFENYLKKSILVLENDSEVKFRNAKLDSNVAEGASQTEKILPVNLSLIKKTANTVSFDIEIQDNAFMLYTDLYHRGFDANIDGKKASILKGMGVFKAVELSKGRHIVEFQFRPFHTYVIFLYLVVSVGFFVFAGIYGIAKIYKKIKNDKRLNADALIRDF